MVVISGRERVTELRAVEPISLDTREDVVACIERLLDRARTGELTSVAFAGVLADGSITTGFELSNAGNVMLLCSAAHHLAWRIHREGFEQMTDD